MARTDLKKFRACPCLTGYFRLNRFGVCKPCSYGYYCSNESVNLMPGFYWTWQQPNHTQEYQTFASKLQEESKQHDRDWDSFNGSLPMAYRCPFTGSCKGDFNATCSRGYEGVLCAECSRGYYRMFSSCNKCPTTPLVITQFVGVFLVLALVAVVVILNRKKSRDDKRSQTDQLFGSLKIVIGFYQILSETLNAYSYIQWPKELLTIMMYADVLQLNIFTIAPIECISDKLKVDPYSSLLGYVLMDCAVIFTAFFYYNIRKMVLTRRCHHDAKDTLFDCKANCYQAVFLFLFITYPAACTKIFQTLPAGFVLSVGLRSGVFQSAVQQVVYFVYASLIIPLLFPMICAFLLWQHCSEKHYISTFAGLKKRINKIRGKSRSIAITSLKETPGEDRATDITSLKETPGEDRAIAIISLRKKPGKDRAIDITSLKETQSEERNIAITSMKETPGEERAIAITSLKKKPGKDKTIDITSLKETQSGDKNIAITSMKETPGEDRSFAMTSLKEKTGEDRAIDINSIKEKPGEDAIKKGLRFMYENYTKDCWYWEIIELLRKVTLTSLLAYYGQDNPFFLGTSAVLSGLYAVFFANQKPIRYVFEYWLHLGSLLAVMATQLMGMVLRIPGEDASVDQEADQIGVTILLIFANLFVIVMIAGRYLYCIWVSLKVVRANPQCSMGCLMNVMQIITQGEEETCKRRRDISESQAEASGQEAVQEIH
ncbi:uncharacterized protein LOC5499073 [Nematostella vectensis]|uniref:uncharacterized protein LOC5499073 n=1 Tax=Nematostella vectensis TaxID=45351 RepID=UPI002076F41F|nr:uncharacterized protein LOC5499073 [Nematostella vectensis]